MKPVFESSKEDEHRRICMLMITHACNLNCRYCYESYKDSKCMSFDMAKEIILKEMEFVSNSNGRFKDLQIDFMGGEPLMNFDLIKRVVEWIGTTSFSVPCISFASTNGTLLNETTKKWFRENKDKIWLSLSYDGDDWCQWNNRHTLANSIDLDFFQEMWPEQTFKMTISKMTLPHMADGIMSILKRGWLIDASIAQGEDWNRDDAIVLRDQLKRFINAYLSGEVKGTFSMVKRDLSYIAREVSNEDLRFCGSGTNMVTYDVDGKCYGCHLFTPMVQGGKGAMELAALKTEETNLRMESDCQRCILAAFCPTCMGFNYKYRGNVCCRDKRHCLMNLVLAQEACEFQVRSLSTKGLNSLIDAEFAKAALHAWDVLSHFDCRESTYPFVLASKAERR